MTGRLISTVTCVCIWCGSLCFFLLLLGLEQDLHQEHLLSKTNLWVAYEIKRTWVTTTIPFGPSCTTAMWVGSCVGKTTIQSHHFWQPHFSLWIYRKHVFIFSAEDNKQEVEKKICIFFFLVSIENRSGRPEDQKVCAKLLSDDNWWFNCILVNGLALLFATWWACSNMKGQ